MKSLFLAVAILVPVLSPGVSAQERISDLPQIGQRVRVTVTASTLRPEPWIGRFSAISSNNLTFTTAGGATHVFALTAIDRLEVDRGRGRGRSVLTGAGIGLAAAATLAAVLPCHDGVISHCHFFGAIIFGIPATFIGAVAGALHGGERWIDVPIR